VTPDEVRNIEVVRRYFDGCSSGNLDDLLSTLDTDVVHYFLPARLPTIRGAEHLARHWRKYTLVLDPIWSIDHIVVQGNELVSEWSCVWTPAGSTRRLMLRGTEWYVLRDSRIAEIRAYLIYDETGDTGLADFPYAARGYLTD
jgi:ketosteroid isomerase-like protein